jgi:hypothetical protein
MMLHWRKIVMFILVILFTGAGEVYAQTTDAGNTNGGAGTEAQPTGRAGRRKAKREWKKERKKKMEDDKARKDYIKDHNTKKTQKRMKKSQKKANRNNSHKREFFLKRWFKKRK